MLFSWCLVRSPPTFIQPPADVIAVEGRTAKLDCRTSGSTLITWTHDNYQVTLSSRITVDNIGALIIHSVEKGDEGMYACFASNRDGHITANGFLTVKSELAVVVSVSSGVIAPTKIVAVDVYCK